MKKVFDFLKNLGLSEAETKIYVKLLETGHCSITELAHLLSMNRITVHFNVQNLIDKGLITNIKHGRSRELSAQSPETLHYLIEQKEKTLSHLREEFNGILPVMTKFMPTVDTSNHKFDVKFFQGKQGVRAIYREVLKAKELRSFVNISSIFDKFPENPQLFPDAVSHKHLRMWEIIEDSPVSRTYVKTVDPKLYRYKFFPSEWNLHAFDFMIFDGKVAMIAAGSDQMNGILIENEDIYKNLRAIFEIQWALLPDTNKLSTRLPMPS